MKTALLVIDVQNFYVTEGEDLYCPTHAKTIANINKLIEQADKNKQPIIYVRHEHKEDGSDVGLMFNFTQEDDGVYLVAGTNDVDYAPGLKHASDKIEITKARYSSFYKTDLDKILKDKGIQKVTICGFMTNFCCDTTSRDAHARDYFVDFIVDATGTPGTDSFNEDQVRKATSETLAAGFARIYSTEDYTK